MDNIVYIIITVIVALFILCNVNKETLQVPAYLKNAAPPFPYPTYIPQPPRNAGWGYRDPKATLQTLLWEQNRLPILLPKYSPYRVPDYVGLSEESYPVPIKSNSTCASRPPTLKASGRPVASSPVATW
jgi:hypothetical protein